MMVTMTTIDFLKLHGKICFQRGFKHDLMFLDE